MSDIPDYVPMLTKGIGTTPQEGGCIVQIANWLSDNTLWTDEPVCVHPTLATWAMTINDLVGEKTRQKMALLASRLTGTRIADKFQSVDVSIGLFSWYRNNPIPFYSKLCGPKMKEGEATCWFEYGVHSEAQALAWITEAIDEYDRLTGRQHGPLLSEEQGRSLCEVMGQ